MTALGCVFNLSGCGPSGPDFTPIGDGLKAVGICIVCGCVVHALGALVRGDGK